MLEYLPLVLIVDLPTRHTGDSPITHVPSEETHDM